ncbi:MAG: hypothetical protein OEL55_04395 [Desulfobulbaceae bacterium]|nr:hypothetical protein [Desulfobulbaceae bacterium]
MINLSSFPKLARQNLIVLCGCITALLILAGITLLPDTHKHRHQTRAIEHLQARLNEQNDMNTLYQKLETKISAQSSLDTKQPTKPAPLPTKEIKNIAAILQKFATQEGLTLDQVQPAIEKGNLTPNRIRIQARLHGHLEQHRALLLDLLREPYVDELEHLSFEASGKDITLRIILAINVA